MSGVFGTARHFIDGAWEEALGARKGLTNPATGEPLGDVVLGTAGDLDRAVRAAARAYESWRHVPVANRARFLFALRDLMEAHFDELVTLCTDEHGKTLEESRGDVRRGIDNVETAIGMPTLMMGTALEQIAGGIDCTSVRQPMGVFGIIAPYNFPSMVPMWFLPYAVASGNTVIVKPSEQVPFSQTRIFELLEQVGLPSGVVNLVQGAGDVANALLEHPDVRGLSFVGSTPVARHVYARAGATGKRVQALGGAKNFAIVMDDCDWAKSIPNLLESAFGCAGQRCLATSVVIGVGEAAARLESELLRGAKEIVVGHGRDPGVTMGPLISAAHKERVSDWIARGVNEGAELLLDGRSRARPSHLPGHFLGPSLFRNVTPAMAIAREEIFGPVLCILHAKDLEQAIALTNAHPLANAASIYTSSGAHARAFTHEIHASMTGVNVGVAAPMSYFGFGGAKDSFFGDLKAHGREAALFYTQSKTSIQRWW